MTSTMNSAFDYFLNIIHNTSIFSSGNSFIIVLVFGLLISIIISLKKISNIKTLMFPVLYGLFLLDFTVPIVILVLAGFVFALDILSIQIIGSIISTASSGFEAVKDRFSYENRVSRDIKRYNQRTQHLTALEKYGDTFDKKIWLMNKKDRNKYMKILQNRQIDKMEKEREEIRKRNRLQEIEDGLRPNKTKYYENLNKLGFKKIEIEDERESWNNQIKNAISNKIRQVGRRLTPLEMDEIYKNVRRNK